MSYVGDLQSTLVAMKDCAYEASVALTAFGQVIRGHTALTSECGSMLEEVIVLVNLREQFHYCCNGPSKFHYWRCLRVVMG